MNFLQIFAKTPPAKIAPLLEGGSVYEGATGRRANETKGLIEHTSPNPPITPPPPPPHPELPTAEWLKRFDPALYAVREGNGLGMFESPKPAFIVSLAKLTPNVLLITPEEAARYQVLTRELKIAADKANALNFQAARKQVAALQEQAIASENPNNQPAAALEELAEEFATRRGLIRAKMFPMREESARIRNEVRKRFVGLAIGIFEKWDREERAACEQLAMNFAPNHRQRSLLRLIRGRWVQQFEADTVNQLIVARGLAR